LKCDYPNAIAAYNMALEFLNEDPDKCGERGVVFNDLGSAKRLSGNYDEAEADYREALRVAHGARHAEGIAECSSNLALLALDREDWVLAERLVLEALLLSEEIGRKELIALNLTCLAKALARQNRAAEALPHARHAVEVYTRLGSPDLESALATLRECGEDTA
jgi:tetratricopeptide (TPR) repeat protein